MSRPLMRLICTALALAFLIVAGVRAQTQTEPPFRPTALSVDRGVKVATAVAGTAMLNKNSGVITTESLTTAAGASYVLTITDSAAEATDMVFASVAFGTASQGAPDVMLAASHPGSIVVTIRNAGTVAFNGTIKVSYMALRL